MIPSIKTKIVDGAIEESKEKYKKTENAQEKQEIIEDLLAEIADLLRNYDFRIQKLDTVPNYYVLAWAENNMVILKTWQF